MAAFLVLPAGVLAAIAAGLGINAVEQGGGAGLVYLVGILAWPALLLLLYRALGLRGWRLGRVVGITVIFGSVFFTVELIGGGSALLASDNGSGWAGVYLVLAVLLPLLLVPLLRRAMGMRRREVAEQRAGWQAGALPADPTQPGSEAERRLREQLEGDRTAAQRRVEARREAPRRRDRRRPRP